MKNRITIFLLLFAFVGLSNLNVKAQKGIDDLTFEQAAKYYAFWEKQLYPLQRELIFTEWTKAHIDRVNKLPSLEKRMKKDMASHPNYFKLYPKQLKGIRQSQSLDGTNYQNYKSFAMAGEKEDPPANSKTYISFYKRYCYWRKFMDDNAEHALKTSANYLLSAEKANETKRVEKLKYALEYAKAINVLYPNNAKAEMVLNRAKKSLGQNAAPEGQGGDFASYYESKRVMISRDLRYIQDRPFSEAMLVTLKKFNYPELVKRMDADMKKYPEYFKIYPAKLPTSGMGCMTQKNVAQFSEYNVADASAQPPGNMIAKKVLKFYQEFCYWHKVLKQSTSMVSNLRTEITKVDGTHQDYKYEKAIYVKRYAQAAHELLPENEQITDLLEEANSTYNSVVSGLGSIISGKFHKTHLQKIVVFNKKPNWGQEKEADIIETIIPGKTAYITGYFTAKNSMGLPTLVLLDANHKYANEWDVWSKAIIDYAKVPMFNQLALKKEYKDKAYFTFNLFPDIDKTNYESHVQYIPHLNFIKWLIYQPKEVLTFKVKWGKTKLMAEGVIKIDLTGNAKQFLKDYLKKMEAKRLSMVKYPKMEGCQNAMGSLTNFSDLSQYGKVLRLTLSKAGDIMKPWPNDDKVDWNTAKGFAAVEQTDGKVIIIPLDFRKRPTASKWKWWSIGKFPTLFPLNYQAADINAVKKINNGYEIPKQNVNKCGTWYKI